MLQVRFEPTIPAFERAKTVHALDHAAPVIDLQHYHNMKMLSKTVQIPLIITLYMCTTQPSMERHWS
jgi:hypothetical protein